MTTLQAVRERFRERFQGDPTLFRAPGRINLIGEHTDYNDGYVLPAAIDKYCYAAVSPRADRRLIIHSEQFAQTAEIDLSGVADVRPRGTWSDYPVGVATVLMREGLMLGGANLLLHGDVPLGAGLSSSAAVEVATAIGLLDVAKEKMSARQIAMICQRAENDFVGARCGIMDQFASTSGQTGMAMRLDCRTLDHEWLPIPANVRLVVCNTMTKHAIAHGEYNRRRTECEQAVQALAQRRPEIRALRDLSMAQLEDDAGLLPTTVYRRAKHVVGENARVLDAAAALQEAGVGRVGTLMNESHVSLRDLYEVSSAELDTMVELARRQPGVYGSRMMGGGFGGCTINMIDSRYTQEFCSAMQSDYQAARGVSPEIYLCEAVQGAGPIEDTPA